MGTTDVVKRTNTEVFYDLLQKPDVIEAMKIAVPAYKAWYDSLVHLWRKFRSIPYHFAESLEIALAKDSAIVGSPATVRAEIERHIAESRCNYFVTRFAYGTLTHEQAARSVALFATEVMPKLK